jgi:long-chain acyl-CoA synthetase
MRAGELLDARHAGSAIEFDDERWTHAELDALANRFAHWFQRAGLVPGDRVSLLFGNDPLMIGAYFGAFRSGLVANPINTRLTPPEVAYVLNHAGSRCVVVSAEFEALLRETLPLLDRQPIVLCLRGSDAPRIGAALLACPTVEIEPIALQPDDGALLIYTSGTTGHPKGVVHTHASLIDRAQAGAAFDKLTSAEEVLAYLPPAWIGQNIFSYAQWLACGYVVNCPESASTVSIDLNEIGPTYYFAPPRIFEGLLTTVMIRMEDAGRLKRALFHRCMELARRVGPRLMDGQPVSFVDRASYAVGDLLIYGPLRNTLGLSRVRVAYTAGEAIGPDLFSFYRSIGINLKQLYGSTETAVFVCLQPDHEARADTVGVPIEGVEIKLSDAGEVLVKSKGLLREYYKNPEATAEVLTPEGWYHTGDAGFLDAGGHLKIIDRAKDVGRLRGGAFDRALFAPKYVENKLKFFSFIKEAVAFGDGREIVCAFINIDFEAVGNWAEKRNLAYAGYPDLAQKPEVVGLIRDCVEKVNADLALDAMLAGSQISRFLILHKELDADDGELTRTRKVRRGFIAERYQVLVDALYGGKTSQYIETTVKFEDGRSGMVAADLKISEAKTFAPIGKAA